MSTETYFRLLGQRPFPIYPGDSVAVVDYLTSRLPGAGWSAAGIVPLAGVFRTRAVLSVDPGAGGFPTGTLLYVLPNQSDIPPTLTGSTAEGPSSSFFAPGVYSLRCEYTFGATATIGNGYMWQVAQKDTPGPNPVTPLPGRALGRFVMGRQVAIWSPHRFSVRFMAIEPWKLELRCATAVVDADTFSVDVDVECEVPTDQPEGT